MAEVMEKRRWDGKEMADFGFLGLGLRYHGLWVAIKGMGDRFFSHNNSIIVFLKTEWGYIRRWNVFEGILKPMSNLMRKL